MGECGEYEDRAVWASRVCFSEQEAQDWIKNVELLYREAWIKWRDGNRDIPEVHQFTSAITSFDPCAEPHIKEWPEQIRYFYQGVPE